MFKFSFCKTPASGHNSEKINWEEGNTTFEQYKTKGTVEETVPTYSKHVLECLKEYLARSTG